MPRVPTRHNPYGKRYDTVSLAALGASLVAVETQLGMAFLPLPQYRALKNKKRAILAQMSNAVHQMAMYSRRKK